MIINLTKGISVVKESIRIASGQGFWGDLPQAPVDQVKRGDLDYDDDNVYWKGKVYPRATMDEGAKNLPWEAEAYRKS